MQSVSRYEVDVNQQEELAEILAILVEATRILGDEQITLKRRVYVANRKLSGALARLEGEPR